MARLATRDRTAKSGGFLVVEAIVACFLFVFSFAASAALFEASLRWEGQSSNYRQAGFLAERKMEEIRASVSQIPSGLSFSQHLDSILSGPHPPYDGFSEFEFEVELLDNEHKVVESSGFKPDDGVHSPCSAFYTRPDTPLSSFISACLVTQKMIFCQVLLSHLLLYQKLLLLHFWQG